MVDLYHSRRTNYKRCAYYKRDERVSIGDMGKWIAEHTPTGYFYAKRINTTQKQNNVVVNVFEFKQTYLSLQTNDDISDIENDDLVLYKNTLYTVDSVQQIEHSKETQFSDGEHYTTILGLRK